MISECIRSVESSTHSKWWFGTWFWNIVSSTNLNILSRTWRSLYVCSVYVEILRNLGFTKIIRFLRIQQRLECWKSFFPCVFAREEGAKIDWFGRIEPAVVAHFLFIHIFFFLPVCAIHGLPEVRCHIIFISLSRGSYPSAKYAEITYPVTGAFKRTSLLFSRTNVTVSEKRRSNYNNILYMLVILLLFPSFILKSRATVKNIVNIF
jgi:hypothetical protein